MAKAVIKILNIVLISIGLAFLVLALFLHVSFKLSMEDMLAESVGVPVKMESASLDLLNSQIHMRGIEFLNPDTFPQGPLAKVPLITVDFQMQSFKEKKIILDLVKIDAKELHILRDSKGRFNWFHIQSFKNKDGAFRRTGFMALMNDWPLEIDRYVMDLGQALYTDFSRPVPLKRIITMNLEKAEYKNPKSMMAIVKILAWEALIRVDQGELQEAFDIVEEKVEEKLGTRQAFLERWHQGKNTGLAIKEQKGIANPIAVQPIKPL